MSGPSSQALASLADEQRTFIHNLPKAELHAHLNGSIPLPTLRQLAKERRLTKERDEDPKTSINDMIEEGIAVFENELKLDQIADFFTLFPAIYALTSTPETTSRITSAVLKRFLDPEYGPQCTYIELRTTPRSNGGMTREDYLNAVLDAIEEVPEGQAALIVSIDRRMAETDAMECADLAIKLRKEGRRVVGIDLCGDTSKGDIKTLVPALQKAKVAGLPLTLHIAETLENVPETKTLLALGPSRLGHATFLSDKERMVVLERKIPVEICLSSNLLCKTVKSLDDHHVLFWLKHDHPIAISTDDTLPFRTSLAEEYALLLAQPPLGLGLSEDQVRKLAEAGLASRFK